MYINLWGQWRHCILWYAKFNVCNTKFDVLHASFYVLCQFSFMLNANLNVYNKNHHLCVFLSLNSYMLDQHSFMLCQFQYMLHDNLCVGMLKTVHFASLWIYAIPGYRFLLYCLFMFIYFHYLSIYFAFICDTTPSIKILQGSRTTSYCKWWLPLTMMEKVEPLANLDTTKMREDNTTKDLILGIA